MSPSPENTADMDELDVLANYDDFHHMADEKCSAVENDFKKGYSLDTFDDDNEESMNEEFLDKVVHHDVIDLLNDIPEISNKDEVADENISLGSCLDKSDFLEDFEISLDGLYPADSSEALKFQADICKENEDFLTDLNFPLAMNHPAEETMSGIKKCDVSAVVEEIKECKTSCIHPKTSELKPLNQEVSTTKYKQQREEMMSSHFLDTGEYRDFSQVDHECIFNGLKFGSMRGRPQEPFPAKLHKIVEQSEADGYSSLISWLPHGRAFKIHNTSLFIERVMKKYFYQTKISSFQRQLKVYGFYRLQNNLDEGAYCHELFLRGRPGLCAGIIRKKSRKTVELKKEPNFYAMPPVGTITIHPCKIEPFSSERNSGEPRTVCYLNKKNQAETGEGTEAEEEAEVNETLLPEPEHVASAPDSEAPPPAPVPVSDASLPINIPAKSVNSKPTPIRIIRNGKALTKSDVKSGGFRLVTSISNKHPKTAMPSVNSQVSFMVVQGFPMK